MKTDKATRAPHILLMTKRFNEVSQLVVSEIIRRSNMSARVAAIEKWAAVADISRVLHNYNGVLQICAAFTNSSVFRLKKTWEKVSKTVRDNHESSTILKWRMRNIYVLFRLFYRRSKRSRDYRISCLRTVALEIYGTLCIDAIHLAFLI